MPDPLISVVMGVYNGAAYLDESIQSVLAQTLTDFEFIIVNDGSTDSLVNRILSDHAENDDRIILIQQSNAGLTQALINGCARAKGAFIARIDVGDCFAPSFLAMQHSVIGSANDIVFVSCWTLFCGPEWEPLYKGKTTAPNGGHSILKKNSGTSLLCGPTSHGAVMYRRDAYQHVGGYRGCFYYGQDMDLWCRLAETGKFAAVPEPLYQARIFPNGISAVNRLRQREIGLCSRGALAARVRGEDENPFLKRAALILPVKEGNRKVGEGAHFIAELLRLNGDLRCRRYFRQALRQNPLRLNTWFRFLQSFPLMTKSKY